MIRNPSDADLPQLQALWQEAFGDSEEDTAHYFKHRHQHENMLVFLSGNEVAAMLSLLPVKLVTPEKTEKARYIFAVATKKNHRGQGISTKLLEAAHQSIKSEGGVAGILVPAESSLFAFYEKRGYQTTFYIDEAKRNAKDLPSPHQEDSIEVCGAEDYLTLRDSLCKSNALFVRWGIEALTYIKSSFERAGGAMFRMSVNGKPALAVCAPSGNEVQVTELLCDKGFLDRCLALIHSQMKADSYLVRTPQGRQNKGFARPFGMIHWLKEPLESEGEPPYLSFAKD